MAYKIENRKEPKTSRCSENKFSCVHYDLALASLNKAATVDQKRSEASKIKIKKFLFFFLLIFKLEIQYVL